MKNLLTKRSKNLIKSGDIFQLGDHRLLCGDATDQNLIKKLLGKDKVDLLLCDPPYGIAYTQSKRGFSTVKVDKDIANDELCLGPDYTIFTKVWLEPILPYLACKNAIYIFNSDKMLFALREGMQQARVNFSQLLIWVKNQPVIGRKDYLPQHELIAYGWFGTHQFHKSKDKSVLFYPKPNRSTLHPTTKPIPLLRHLILNSTKTRNIVYDCFGGSGSTLLACEQTRRKCLTIEIDPEYCLTIINQFEKLTGLKAKQLWYPKTKKNNY